jgi:uncharacterized protein (DUF433 family)
VTADDGTDECYSPLVTERITIEPGKGSGQPCIRALRITVWDVLNWLAGGMTEKEILEDYPELEPEDFRASMSSRRGSAGASLLQTRRNCDAHCAEARSNRIRGRPLGPRK